MVLITKFNALQDTLATAWEPAGSNMEGIVAMYEVDLSVSNQHRWLHKSLKLEGEPHIWF